MKVHPSKTVCVANGKLARKVLQNFTKHRRLPRMVVTTKDLGVDVQWTARRNLTQQTRVQNFRKGMERLAHQCLCKPIRARIVRALQPMAMYGSEVIGMSEASLGSLRA
eukprot:5527845-Amphidinium_carterae.1